jgi:dipeptidyl aminopeptidase/acylaminoacyl peptidase
MRATRCSGSDSRRASGWDRRRLGVAVALLGAAVVACRAPPQTAEHGAALDGRPSLEEIFLIPGVQGRPPQIERVSADGAWMTLRWNPVVENERGEREISSRNALRVLSTIDPEASSYRGTPLAEILPPVPPRALAAPVNEKEGAADRPLSRGADEGSILARWSRHGARLAVARGRRIYLLDAPREPQGVWRASLLYDEPSGDGEKLGDIDAIEFERDDSALRVVADKELWLLPLAADDGHPWPIPIESARCLTRDIEAPASALQWSDDLRVALGAKPPAAWLTPTQPEPAAESKPAERQPAHVVEIESGRRVALEGIADMRWIESAALSPDGRFVFAEDPDKSAEPAPTLVPDYLTPRVTTREARRELADDLPAPCKLWMWDVESGVRSSIELGGDGVAWFREIGWAPRPDKSGPTRYAFSRLARDFRTLEYWCWSEGELSLLLTDRDDRWMGGPTEGARWSRDGRFIVFGSESLASSDSHGKNQLFRLDPECGTTEQLTHVSGEVSSFSLQDDGGVVFTYSEAEHPERRRLGWVTPRGEVRTLAAPEGFLSNLAPTARAGSVAFRLERLGEPGEVWITSQVTDAAPRQLTRTIPERYEEIGWIRPQLFAVDGDRGARVRSHVFLPRSSSLARPDRPRPAIVFIHGAGYLQNVTDSMTEYEVNLMFHSRLAAMGYAVVDVDYRGSEGYGRDFRTDVQGWLGKYELDDIRRTIDALAARGVIDAKRVGCYGGSYGGFLVLMALFLEPERWSCGAALRSVTDWRTYHPGYTQPRLGRPSTDAEAYARSSPIDHAEGLADPLLILHGMVDTNVFAQDSIRLIEKLIDLGKDFDAMLYPSQGHGFQDGRHWVDEYKRIERFMVQHLGPP